MTSRLSGISSRLLRLMILLQREIRRQGGIVRFLKRLCTIMHTRKWIIIARRWRKIKLQSRDPGLLDDYQYWIRYFESPLSEEINQTLAGKHTDVPLISILMPVHDPELKFLQAAIHSVQQQRYPHWELCIADDCSQNPQIIHFLQASAKQDRRIKVTFAQQHGHISRTSNQALAMARGAFIALMDHDDVIPSHALACVARVIMQFPDVRLIYSDEDKIDEKGMRYGAYFKPDWNLHLFYSQNLFSHLGVYQRELIIKAGGFREGYEGSQDYDLVLRCLLHIRASQIMHIPLILYHWRACSGSAAQNESAKPYARKAAVAALQDYIKTGNLAAEVQIHNGSWRLKYLPAGKNPLISIIIPVRDNADLLTRCIDSILDKTCYSPLEILIINNQSRQQQCLELLWQLNRHPCIRVYDYDHGFNYAAINNYAVKHAKGDVLVLLNNDTRIISRDWLEEMLAYVIQESIGAVGAKLLFPDETVQHAGVIIGLGGVAGHVHLGLDKNEAGYFGRAVLPQEFSAVTAACLMVKKKDYVQVGGMDETDLKVAFNDVDFCLKLKSQGKLNIYTPYACLFHITSASRGDDSSDEQKQRFAHEIAVMQQRWEAFIQHDPAYNPNLTLFYPDMSVAIPFRHDIRLFGRKNNTAAHPDKHKNTTNKP